jgi:acetyl esterase/lipase
VTRYLTGLMLVSIAFWGSGSLSSQEDVTRSAGRDTAATRASPSQPTPTHSAVVYGTDNPTRQVMDVYLAESDTPTPVLAHIHGGGWSAGSYKRIPSFLAQSLQPAGVSMVSVEYRFTDEAIHPAQTADCLRAIQFVRSKSAEWNLDPKRIGVTGGSAGAHLALWVAVHDDVADPQSSDPVARQSSRVSCAVSFAGPTDFHLLGQVRHNHPAYWQLLGHEPQAPLASIDARMVDDVSPITFVTRDDPPILLCHGSDDKTVPVEHARTMDERLRVAGVESKLLVVDKVGHNPAASETVRAEAVAFIKRHLLAPKGTESEPR